MNEDFEQLVEQATEDMYKTVSQPRRTQAEKMRALSIEFAPKVSKD